MVAPVGKLSSREAKSELIKLIGQGKTVEEACRLVGKSVDTYAYYRKSDPEFVSNIDRMRLLVARGKGTVERPPVPDFPEFSEKYFGQRLFTHQLQWVDLLEGREPRGLHASETYTLGRPNRVVVNTPTGHAKSTTLTVNYVVWRIVRDPNVRIKIVSKSQRMAEDFLLQVKERLTSPVYERLQMDFGPPGGWNANSSSWKANRIYVSSDIRDVEQKDPTVEALGIRGQIYGARADLIILDDCVDNTNVGEVDKQIGWIQGMLLNRLSRAGRILVVGTRIASRDLYSELLNPAYYGGRPAPWTYLRQPAVLEFAEDPRDWVVLWPRTDQPEADEDGMPQEPDADGLYLKFDGHRLAEIRDEVGPTAFSRMFQQETVAEDAVFTPEVVAECIDARKPGLIPDDERGRVGRPGGMRGLKIIAGLDPAAIGYTAAVVMGVDTSSGVRWVFDVSNVAGMSPDAMRQLIKDWTDRYGIHEWRIERNAFQAFLTRDTEIVSFLAGRGTVLTEHVTGNNKRDPNFGVMAMAGLFRSGLLRLPRPTTEAAKALVDQLVTWQPDPPKSQKTDCVMALWFAELRAGELVQRVETKRAFRPSEFHTRMDVSMRVLRPVEDVPGEQDAQLSWWGPSIGGRFK